MKKVFVFAVLTGFLLAGFSGQAFAKPFSSHIKKSSQMADEKDKDVKAKEKKHKKHKGNSKKY